MTTHDNGAIETPDWSPVPHDSELEDLIFERLKAAEPRIPPNIILGSE